MSCSLPVETKKSRDDVYCNEVEKSKENNDECRNEVSRFTY